MRFASLFFSLLLMAPVIGFAQNANDQGNNMNSQEHTIRGCLAGSPNQYRLTTKNGTTHMLMGDEQDLGSHVGQMVELSGKADNNRDASASSNNGMMNGQRFFRVDSVKEIQGNCKK